MNSTESNIAYMLATWEFQAAVRDIAEKGYGTIDEALDAYNRETLRILAKESEINL